MSGWDWREVMTSFAELQAYGAGLPPEVRWPDIYRRYFAPAVFDALEAVLDVHRPFHIYDECEHKHEMPEGHKLPEGLHLIEDVGLVCDDGYLYSICRECCADDTFQNEECATYHKHSGDAACWPCPTVRAISQSLTEGNQ